LTKLLFFNWKSRLLCRNTRCFKLSARFEQRRTEI